MKKVNETVLCFAIAIVITLVVFVAVWYFIAFLDGMRFTCDLCRDDVWQIPKKFEVLGQEVKICKDCVKTVREVGEQIGSLFG